MVKIGLEIHGYLTTKEKLFCKCKNAHKDKEVKPNTLICPTCTGQPGSKPMLPNEEAIKKIIQIGLMLDCKINIKDKLVWNRKHYSWPDLPKGYQITMSGAYSIPLGEKGKFEDIRITEVHLEEDPAAWDPESGCVDYNRSGIPLVEIVTEPDFTSSEQVISWLKKLTLTLAYIKSLDTNAGIKADVNVSIAKNKFERVEIKNLSSLENIRKAIEHEIQRQEKEPVKRETRRYDPIKDKTVAMRDKEQAEDYRFIPDPDLPIIKINEKQVMEIKKQLPESPQQKINKLIREYKLEKKQADIITQNLELVEFFEKVAEKINPKFALPWITTELLRVLNYNKKTLNEVSINPEHFIELLEAVKSSKITELKAKQILNEFVPSSFSLKKRLEKESTIDNKSEIEEIVKEVIKKNPKAVQDYKSGEKNALNFLIGEIMKSSNKRADYPTSKIILLKHLK